MKIAEAPGPMLCPAGCGWVMHYEREPKPKHPEWFVIAQCPECKRRFQLRLQLRDAEELE